MATACLQLASWWRKRWCWAAALLSFVLVAKIADDCVSLTRLLDQMDSATIQMAVKDQDGEATMVATDSHQKQSFELPHHPVCRPSWRGKPFDSIRRVYFAHTRKAGGTYVRELLKKHLVAPHGLVYFEEEGRRLSEEPGSRNDTVYVTNVRHPVHRIISSFKFEGRGTSCPRNTTSHSLYYRTPPENKSRPLEKFVDKVCPRPKIAQRGQCITQATTTTTTATNVTKKKNLPLWFCAESCLMRWYGPRFDCLSENLTESMHETLDRLSRFDLIVDQGRMSKDPTYVPSLLLMFGASPSEAPPDPNLAQPPCGTEAQVWNNESPPELRNETLQRLHEMNKVDIDLYDELTSCPEGVIIPRLNPS